MEGDDGIFGNLHSSNLCLSSKVSVFKRRGIIVDRFETVHCFSACLGLAIALVYIKVFGDAPVVECIRFNAF